MIFNFIQEFFSPTVHPTREEYSNLYIMVLKLQKRIEVLEQENIETTNTLYELINSIYALDERIDILTLEKWKEKNV